MNCRRPMPWSIVPHGLYRFIVIFAMPKAIPHYIEKRNSVDANNPQTNS